MLGDSLEEEITFTVPKNVFYNPQMTLCRSISSLAVGAVKQDLELVDAFCATGIRGIRYVKENKNVTHITFLDIEKTAITAAKKNAKTNNLKFDAKYGNISKLAFELTADFLEIDPFGTPSPYLVDAFRFFNPKKTAYLSITATDVAVLCGARMAPCLKNYHAKPLNNEFTHETGLRILIKRIAEVAAEFNMGIEPLISFSDKHYLKTILKVSRSADLVHKSMKELGHVYYCNTCGFRGFSQFPQPCTKCNKETDFAGPLWLGELHNPSFLKTMKTLNSKRNYSEKDEISHMLSLMENEVGMPPYYYNIHVLSKFLRRGQIPKIDTIISRLQKDFKATRTHFSNISIKTNAPYDKILEAMEC
ncbi:tRNA (guanine(10)-N(2))-dimethyltransferase [Candidatus Micrarchaeota archaeon]|nr:tRNA (guanine(10)-N(2))-dimethyltransferase [Candidatus Micrarchaeota archaeon]